MAVWLRQLIPVLLVPTLRCKYNVRIPLLVYSAFLVVTTVTQDGNASITAETNPGGGRTGRQQNYTEEFQETTSSNPWPPPKATSNASATSAPPEYDVTTETLIKQQKNSVKPTQDSSTEDGVTQGYDVMQSLTFRAILGVCMSLVCMLVVALIVMMIYTKYRGWKDRMNVGPTVRVGDQVSHDRQELMT